MSLTAGTRFGPYEILSLLGVGGMGEVYRARDTKLGREVALKVLPETFAHDPERLARFKREAQVLASLNHPNIAAIYGFEESNGIQALVLELVEGPTLADVIGPQRVGRALSGPPGSPDLIRSGLQVAEALPIARQIAHALEAAHEQGIIHRDLKPANIKLRSDGTVKVLDFGLAKAMEPVGSAPSVSQSPTITTPAHLREDYGGQAMTQAGVILGTAAYMAPEQAKGRAADKRSDIWAFGCVLYEMLTGTRPFDGEDVSDTLANVLKIDPDWSVLPAETPPAIRTLLQSCLTKDRRRRVADISTALFVLENGASLAPTASTVSAAPLPRRLRWRRGALVAAAALVVGGAAAGGAVWIATRPGPARVVRTTIQTSGDTVLVNTFNNNLAITPDGSRVVYQGASRLLVRRLDSIEPTTLTDLGSPTAPFVSPDSQWVGFFDGPALKKVAITGGPPVTVVPNTFSGAGGPLGATWSAQGTIVFATSTTRGLRRVSPAGGEVETLTTPDRARGELRHSWPEFLPDGQGLIFTIYSSADDGSTFDIVLLDLATATQTVLIRGGNHGRYLPTGHLLYGADDTLRAVVFDVERRAVVGTPVPVLAPVGSGVSGAYEFDVAADGTLVYLTSGAASVTRTLVWVDRQGRETPLGAPARPYLHPRLAPDGTRLAVLSQQERGLWIWDFARATLTRAVLDEGRGVVPLWTPDSRRLIFSANPGSATNLFVRATDGTGTTTRLTESPNSQHPTGVTPVGTQVVFYEATPTQQRDIRLLTLTPTPQVTPLVETRFDDGGGVVSPDGRWLAYESNSAGEYEIYVRPFPAVDGGLWQVSTAGGVQPLWARNGRELFYVAPDGALMAVAVEAQGSVWSAGAPARLLAGRYFFSREGLTMRQYDVTADGQRFLMMKEEATDTDTTQSIIVVQNWLEELKRLVPTN